MNTPTDMNYGRYTPLDNTGTRRNFFRSAYKNIRFNVAATTTITLTEHHIANPAGLSEELYKDNGDMWRVILHFNGIKNPVQDLYPGRVLRIPSPSAVQAYFSKQSAVVTASSMVI